MDLESILRYGQEMKTEKNYTQHLIYGIILIVVILNVLLIVNYQLTRVREDYDSQISELKANVANLQKDLSEKQGKIESLSSEITKTSQQIEETSLKYDLQIGQLNQQISDLSVESEGFSTVISDVIDAVVSVLTNTGQGSGAIISSNGYVVTNYHVIEGARRASVMTYDGNIYSVELIGYDTKNDLAILKIISNETFDYFDFGNSDNLVTGQKVVALGNPAGLSFTATEGIISSPSRTISGEQYIQTDVTLNPGNSGGPLINSAGKIIGIVNFKISNYEELGFAIPSNRVEDSIEKITE